MKKIPATPFARRNLDKEIAGLRDNRPADWASAHLRRAHEIAEKRDRIPKIALDYEVLPEVIRTACESKLTGFISEKSESLTAHDVFECLHLASEPLVATAALEKQPKTLYQYLADLNTFWTKHGLGIGRGNHPEDGSYSSPFHEFAERVLLALRDPRSRLFDPITDEESAAARAAYYKIPADFFISRDDISAMPFAGDELITDWTLRTYLNSRPASKKSE